MMDWNPLNSSAFTGAGTPWGAPRQAGPDYTKFNADPEAYKGYDSSKLRQALQQRLSANAGLAQGQAMASLNKSGIKGADTARALTDLQGQQALASNEMDANLSLQDYQSKLAERAFAADQFNRQQGWEAQQAMGEEQGRSNLWNSLLGVGAQLGGAYLGNRSGSVKPGAGAGLETTGMSNYNPSGTGFKALDMDLGNSNWWKKQNNAASLYSNPNTSRYGVGQ